MVKAACPKISMTMIDNVENSSATSVFSKKKSLIIIHVVKKLFKFNNMGNNGFHLLCEITYAL